MHAEVEGRGLHRAVAATADGREVGRVGAWPLMGGGRVVCISQLSIYIALNKINVIWFMHILSIHLVCFS